MGIQGRIESLPYMLVLQFRTMTFSRKLFDDFRKSFPLASLIVTVSSKQREMATMSFGLSSSMFRPDIINAVQSEIDPRILEPPKLISELFSSWTQETCSSF